MDVLMNEHLVATVLDILTKKIPTDQWSTHFMTIGFIGYFWTTKLNPNPNQTRRYKLLPPHALRQMDGWAERLMHNAKQSAICLSAGDKNSL